MVGEDEASEIVGYGFGMGFFAVLCLHCNLR